MGIQQSIRPWADVLMHEKEECVERLDLFFT